MTYGFGEEGLVSGFICDFDSGVEFVLLQGVHMKWCDEFELARTPGFHAVWNRGV